ncbi:hypothetical protein IFM89_038025 [Coptis chinensis]|uniref:Uncharacterized protein n=1 Tax=Coptis chinensis TaxID=261450 RepID=A0A835HSX3_9MAGN|nr:hypothetical protein IFM89_038025 [Coptis chinensis]
MGLLDAPPKQVAMAMDRLSDVGRLIVDVRIGTDHRLLEALFVASTRPHSTTKTMNLILTEEASMRGHLQDLRFLGSWKNLGFSMDPYDPEVTLGVCTCPLFVQMVLLLHMPGNVNLLVRLVQLPLIEQNWHSSHSLIRRNDFFRTLKISHLEMPRNTVLLKHQRWGNSSLSSLSNDSFEPSREDSIQNLSRLSTGSLDLHV